MITHINKKKSLAKRRLIYRRDWFDRITDIAGVLVFVWMMSYLLLPFFVHNNLEYVHWFFIVPYASFLLYFLYRKSIEYRLIKVYTGLPADEALPVIKQTFTQLSWKEDVYEEHIILFNKNSIFAPYKQVVVFVENDYIYFCVLQFAIRINPPTLYTHYLLKRRLKKIFNKKATTK